MDDWKVLNSLRKSIYCGKGKNFSEDLKCLVSAASRSHDPNFIKSVLQLRDDAETDSTKQKLLWLTSSVHGNFYPPLDVDLAGPLPWNRLHPLETESPKLNSKYSRRTPLRANSDKNLELKQCQDIEDCSLVASLIGMEVHNVELPRVKQIGDDLYMVNLNFNGASNRLISVDTSSVPTDYKGEQLTIQSKDIAYKVIEMAYLQIMTGSYATKGSNCAIDTFRLTGYIPEIVSAEKYEIRRLIKLFQSGSCILALGSGSNSSSLMAPLINDHDYPIVAVGKTFESVMVRDPLDSASLIEVTQSDLSRRYHQVYLSWSHAKLFSYKRRLHFFYDSSKYNEFNSIVGKPLFSLKNRSKLTDSVWILLETNLQDEPISNEHISYLKAVPKNILLDTTSSPEGACNIGLQLQKRDLGPGQEIGMFCHSSKAASFVIHIFSNSKSISINRETDYTAVKSLDFEPHSHGAFGSCDYYKNSTIMLKIVSSLSEEIAVNIQLLSGFSHDMLNLQIYHFDDHSLSRPIMSDANYKEQKYDKIYVPLTTNTPYKIICSSYLKPLSNRFKLLVTTANCQEMQRLQFQLMQVYLEYGELPHHVEKTFNWSQNTNRRKITFTTVTNNICFIRIVPEVRSSLLSIRCNIFDGETHEHLLGSKDFSQPGPGGLVIDNFETTDSSRVVLLIEKDEPRTNGSLSPLLQFKLLIGSQNKITLNG